MSTKQRGTRLIYHATVNTAWVDQAAGAAIPAGWTQVNNVISVNPKPHEPEKFDDSDPEDVAPEPVTYLKPGSVTFSKKKNSQTKTLRDLAAAQTKYTWAVLYIDGTAEYCASGALICNSAGDANTGGFNDKSPESYEIVPDAVLVAKAAA